MSTRIPPKVRVWSFAAGVRIGAMLLAVMWVGIAYALDRDGVGWGLAILGGSIAMAELFPFRLSDGSELSPAYAVIVALIRYSDRRWAVVATVALGMVIASVARYQLPFARRALNVVERAAIAGIGSAVYIALSRELTGMTLRHQLTLEIGVVVLALALVDIALRVGVERELFVVLPAAAGWVAIGATGMLMAFGVRGIGDNNPLGLWSIPLFGIPLAGAWYAFDHVAAVRDTYDQTIDALASIPELGGLTPDGRSRRIARLAVQLGRRIGLDRESLFELEQAALLRELGRVTLDWQDPADPIEPDEVARVTVTLLRKTEGMERVAELVDWARLPYELLPMDEPKHRTMASQALKVAAMFEELTLGDRRKYPQGVDRINYGIRTAFHPRVVRALEALQRDGRIR